MNFKHLTIAALLSCSSAAFAANTKTTITQVTDGVELTTDVDYVITDATPFATSGSVNIKNTDHAVLIINKVKPSVVLAKWMKYILINGEKAVDGTNCQVRMYNRGTIILPYANDIKPLTVFSDADFKGESCNDYSEGSSGGFMKTLTTKNMNNAFKSFKLKRGYMVTFALGTGGWGYSRCFIADTEDLEMNLPNNMSGKVSSYRLFKWWDASKAGVHDTSAAANNALNTTSCFDWAQGNSSLLPDVEWVPNHIYEDWPSAATCGGVTGSCHMKTNNEPGNSADDHPQDVATVLNNWQNLMRTGMRLCSESSHDGSMGHLKEFIEEIDKRGWRCDILDLHCYWQAGTFNNLTWYSDHYGNGRPIWISEWVWGASWNHNGFWGAVSDAGSVSAANQQVLYDNTKPILDVLNSNSRVERYYYWNSEAAGTHIWHDSKLTKLGEYYAKMETGLAYNKKNEYVPKVVYTEPSNIVGTYNKSKGTFAITFDDSNGDMLDSLAIEVKAQGSTKYVWAGNIPLKDINGKTISYSTTVTPETGANYYRIAAYPAGSKTAKYSEAVSVTVSSSKGTDKYQYGNLSVTNTDAIVTDFSESFASNPAVFMGLISNNNASLYPGNLIQGVTKAKFSYQVLPWTVDASYAKTVDKAEQIPFLAIQDTTNYVFGDLNCEVGNVKAKSTETTEVTFTKPFAEGVVPVVITELRNPTLKANAISIRVWDVTNTGFKMTVMYEKGVNKNIAVNQTVCYLAIEPGIGVLDAESELIIAAGHGENLYGATYRPCDFLISDAPAYFSKPLIFGALQTRTYPNATILRRQSDVTVTDKENTLYGFSSGVRVKRQADLSATDDYKNKATADELGWIILANVVPGSTVPTAIQQVLTSASSSLKVKVNNRQISVPGTSSFDVFNASGAKVNASSSLSPGIYVVKSGNKTTKVVIK